MDTLTIAPYVCTVHGSTSSPRTDVNVSAVFTPVLRKGSPRTDRLVIARSTKCDVANQEVATPLYIDSPIHVSGSPRFVALRSR
jgi:hypothetical protein